jgi:hypothetical protein
MDAWDGPEFLCLPFRIPHRSHRSNTRPAPFCTLVGSVPACSLLAPHAPPRPKTGHAAPATTGYGSTLLQSLPSSPPITSHHIAQQLRETPPPRRAMLRRFAQIVFGRVPGRLACTHHQVRHGPIRRAAPAGRPGPIRPSPRAPTPAGSSSGRVRSMQHLGKARADALPGAPPRPEQPSSPAAAHRPRPSRTPLPQQRRRPPASRAASAAAA